MDQGFDNNHYALLFQVYLTKWPEIYAVADRTSATVATVQLNCNFTHLWQSTHGYMQIFACKIQNFPWKS